MRGARGARYDMPLHCVARAHDHWMEVQVGRAGVGGIATPVAPKAQIYWALYENLTLYTRVNRTRNCRKYSNARRRSDQRSAYSSNNYTVQPTASCDAPRCLRSVESITLTPRVMPALARAEGSPPPPSAGPPAQRRASLASISRRTSCTRQHASRRRRGMSRRPHRAGRRPCGHPR